MNRTLIRRNVTGAIAGLVLAAGLAVAVPASAAIPPGDLELPKHVTWQAQQQTPPLQTLLRVFVLVHVHARPHRFSASIGLYRWTRKMTRHGLRWEPVSAGPIAHVGLADIPSAGQNVTWKLGGGIYPVWTCKPGRYFAAMYAQGVNSRGVVRSYTLYTPYAKGHQFQAGAFGTAPPARDESMPIKRC